MTYQRTKGLLEGCREGREEGRADRLPPQRLRGSDAMVLKVWYEIGTP